MATIEGDRYYQESIGARCPSVLTSGNLVVDATCAGRAVA
jgi:hypothetical protein